MYLLYTYPCCPFFLHGSIPLLFPAVHPYSPAQLLSAPDECGRNLCNLWDCHINPLSVEAVVFEAKGFMAGGTGGSFAGGRLFYGFPGRKTSQGVLQGIPGVCDGKLSRHICGAAVRQSGRFAHCHMISKWISPKTSAMLKWKITA